MILESNDATDSHVVAACSQNPLEKLELNGIRGLTRGVIDGIISSQFAATLRDLNITYCEDQDVEDEESYMQEVGIRAGDMLRLVGASPGLSQLHWQREYCPDLRDVPPEELEMKEILAGRGGKFHNIIG